MAENNELGMDTMKPRISVQKLFPDKILQNGSTVNSTILKMETRLF